MSKELRNYINQLFLSDKIDIEEMTKLHELVTKTVCNVLEQKDAEILALFDSRKDINNEN